MKKILIIIPLLFACKKDEPIKSSCNCYKQFQENQFGTFTNTTQSETVQDSCSLDGTIIDYEPYKRYIWVCE